VQSSAAVNGWSDCKEYTRRDTETSLFSEKLPFHGVHLNSESAWGVSTRRFRFFRDFLRGLQGAYNSLHYS